MNPLHYTSEEMFSSTELIRKSKKIFDSLKNKKIDKAIILRDGKPSFMLLDFKEYEKLMQEYEELKNKKKSKSKEKIEKKVKAQEESNIEIEISKIDEPKKEEINEEDLESALNEIENLDLEAIKADEKKEKDPEALKDFWE